MAQNILPKLKFIYIHLIEKTLSGKKYKPQTMRHNGILGKQHGRFFTPFHLIIFKVFFIHGEILDYIY